MAAVVQGVWVGKACVSLPAALQGGTDHVLPPQATPGMNSLDRVLGWGMWRVFCFPKTLKVIAGGVG